MQPCVLRAFGLILRSPSLTCCWILVAVTRACPGTVAGGRADPNGRIPFSDARCCDAPTLTIPQVSPHVRRSQWATGSLTATEEGRQSPPTHAVSESERCTATPTSSVVSARPGALAIAVVYPDPITNPSGAPAGPFPIKPANSLPRGWDQTARRRQPVQMKNLLMFPSPVSAHRPSGGHSKDTGRR
ncbi:hypothetical protein AAFF_G00230310 [Aldrovandia affinis]|uniref:Secreted protein n=1 Tax=Aldrovandia affinis TaxID=143900 RepID=A0AAD7SVU5_9TELE|nr:hypothetical protein AAFF_G00230310 [Aldrovandia affinis]